MHELAITKSLLKTAREVCEENGVKDAKEITVELGLLTTYKKEPLLYYFDALKPNSPALKNSKLVVVEVPGQIICKNCKKKNRIEDIIHIYCPQCNSFDVDIVSGNEIKIKSIVENE